MLSTRRGKQFNTMVWAERDPLTGAGRDALFVADADAAALGVADGDAVLVRSAHGELRARVHLAPIRPGNVQAFFPEANPLLVADGARADVGRARLQRGGRGGPGPMTPEELIDCFDDVARGGARRGRADRRRRPAGRAPTVPGQYALDLIADAAALEVLGKAAGAHRERGVGRARARRARRSPSCSIRSTARRTARAASRTGRSRSARSTPTVRSPRSS